MKMKKFDVKQDVVNRIIDKFETAGEFEMPFKTFGTQNFKSGHKYRGINILLLAMAGYSSPYWGTPKQWIEAGADISGAKCTKIVFWNIKKYEDEETGEEKKVAFAKYYNVLNSEQVQGWEPPVADQKNETEIVAGADEFFSGLGVTTKTAGGCASYNPSTDVIVMPTREEFNATKTSSATETYYSTLAHENVHATMHKSRCDRNMKSYAAEELVAEIGAAMLCEQLGISSEMRDDHVSYIKSWLKALRNDKQFIFTAASKSQEAVDWMNERQDLLSQQSEVK
jgi:antirestriction protein ArdC